MKIFYASLLSAQLRQKTHLRPKLKHKKGELNRPNDTTLFSDRKVRAHHSEVGIDVLLLSSVTKRKGNVPIKTLKKKRAVTKSVQRTDQSICSARASFETLPDDHPSLTGRLNSDDMVFKIAI